MSTSSTYTRSKSPPCFRVTTAANAQTLTDGVELVSFDPDSGRRKPPGHVDAVIVPWLGFGTYKLGNATLALPSLRRALACGYRSIDTAFIYGGETTERLVGQALHEALKLNTTMLIPSRAHVFVTTKHWRKYHGYEPTLQCLNLSLQRLQLEYIDLWLMHWPGPAWSTMNRRKELCQEDPWHYATSSAEDLVQLRAETWRAMEEAVRRRQVRAIGVSNMTVHHLQQLKKTAQLWPPAVNQVELQYVLMTCVCAVLRFCCCLC